MEKYTHRVWISEDEPGIEDVRITHDPDLARGTGFSGAIVRLWEGQPLRVTYRLVCDAEWHALRLVAASSSEAVGERSISLYADSPGNWRDDKGQPLGALQGCIDVDIMLTPLTNTLPIRRLQLAPGESREISVVYIAAPDLSIRPFPQRYTRLDDADGRQRYLYESVESGFTAVLPVDDDGFVVDYPGIWRRVWPAA
ncbi:MAG TPA: putative glycolipid-binding domain-containing protein [Ktedonobacterales bacterium]|jgi:hypothetical protein